jgi:hypothetical protein
MNVKPGTLHVAALALRIVPTRTLTAHETQTPILTRFKGNLEREYGPRRPKESAVADADRVQAKHQNKLHQFSVVRPHLNAPGVVRSLSSSKASGVMTP